MPERVREQVHATYYAWDQPLYPEVQKEIAIKLLSLRYEFRENSKPIDENSTSKNKDLLNQFKVPFRFPAKDPTEDLGSVILLTGEKNMNRDTDQWFGFHGFVARMLGREGASSGNMFAKKRQVESTLQIHTIDVDHWATLNDVSKVSLLSSMLAEPKKKKVSFTL